MQFLYLDPPSKLNQFYLSEEYTKGKLYQGWGRPADPREAQYSQAHGKRALTDPAHINASLPTDSTNSGEGYQI